MSLASLTLNTLRLNDDEFFEIDRLTPTEEDVTFARLLTADFSTGLAFRSHFGFEEFPFFDPVYLTPEYLVPAMLRAVAAMVDDDPTLTRLFKRERQETILTALRCGMFPLADRMVRILIDHQYGIRDELDALRPNYRESPSPALMRKIIETSRRRQTVFGVEQLAFAVNCMSHTGIESTGKGIAAAALELYRAIHGTYSPGREHVFALTEAQEHEGRAHYAALFLKHWAHPHTSPTHH